MNLKKVSIIFIRLIAIWMIGCFISFMSAPAIMFLGSPSWLPLPWSDLGDFIQTKDGKVFIDIQFYNRVLSYDQNGKFVASYPYPVDFLKFTGLAVDEDNNILFKARDDLYIYNSSWEQIEKIVGRDDVHWHWRLDENGRPCYMKRNGKSPTVADSIARPGDFLFRGYIKRRTFKCEDGSKLVRDGNTLIRYSAEGELVGKYGGLWPLKIFEFPLPGILAWPLFFLYYVNKNKKTIMRQIRKRLFFVIFLFF